MRTPIIGRVALALACAVAALAAQAPAGSITLVPNYPSGMHYKYAITIHTAIGAEAQVDTSAEAEMDILPGSTPGHFEAQLRFTRYATTTKAGGAAQAQLAAQAKTTDRAALSMQPVKVEISPGVFTVLGRSGGAAYDQPVDMLTELARTDVLPSGAVSVGDHWTRTRTQAIPAVNTSVTLTMDCSLAAVGEKAATAAIEVHSNGKATIPPGALPGSSAMAAQGVIPEGTVSFSTEAKSIYRVADAVLEQVTSTTDNVMTVRFVGPNAPAAPTNTDIHSTATVSLEP